MSSISETVSNPDIRTGAFEGPLDLLCYLIEKNKVSIYDIPIIDITDQYIDFISKMNIIDMELTTEFLVMASTLLIIKSKMLLPGKQTADGADGDDPREELVIKLLEYRRCKSLAEELRSRYSDYMNCVFKLPETIGSLGIEQVYAGETFSPDSFFSACKVVADRNKIRFFDVSNRILHILKRDRISLKDKMKLIWEGVVSRTRVFFNELFPMDSMNRSERVVGFLALLELLKSDRLKVEQAFPFDVIYIEKNPDTAGEGDLVFEKHFNRQKFEEINYQ
ncbi:MAG: segregation and condensation protein A [Saccharofermentanales bacterium]